MSCSRIQRFSGIVLLTGLAGGCGAAATEEPSTAQQTPAATALVNFTPEKPEDQRSSGITASIESPLKANSAVGEMPVNPSAEALKKSAPEDDAVSQVLQEIQKLRTTPIPPDLEQAKAARRDRNERIVDMATNVLRMTKDDVSRASQFHQAIGQLLEARFQMALAGTQEDVDSLYADVQALNERDPRSIAAAEGVYYVAKFAHTKAGLLGKSQPVWFETFSRWAREFADRFPDQQQRCVSLLFGAARSCELHALSAKEGDLSARLTTESKLCYTMLADKFSATEQGQEATASLRRMSLTGQTLSQFSGPTADGGFVSADEFPGKPTLIYFWESDSEEFAEQVLPLLEKIRSELASERLRIVGVALDDDESTLNSFMETHAVPGQQIFFPNVEQRSWDSPLVRYWGIASSPSIWLVDASGKVVSTNVQTPQLISELKKIVR